MIWQPIDTAPKDGSIIIVSDGSNISVAFWKINYLEYWRDTSPTIQELVVEENNYFEIMRSGEFPTSCGYDLKYWMPVPELPK